jgi:hypothetical protein
MRADLNFFALVSINIVQPDYLKSAKDEIKKRDIRHLGRDDFNSLNNYAKIEVIVIQAILGEVADNFSTPPILKGLTDASPLSGEAVIEALNPALLEILGKAAVVLVRHPGHERHFMNLVRALQTEFKL